MEEDKKLTNAGTNLTEAVFIWKCPEYEKFHKNIQWYVISLAILAVSVVLCIFAKNYLFAIFLVLFYLVVLMYEFRNPNEVDFAITVDGVKSGKDFFYFKSIENFFIIYQDQGIKNLYFDFKNPLHGRLAVPLDGQDAVQIREFLLRFLKEDLEREGEPLSERMMRWLRL